MSELTSAPRRRLGRGARIGAVAAIAMAGLVAVPGAAHATPTDCSMGYYSSTSGWAYCASGSGSFRVKLRCDVPLAPDYNVYGGWRYVSRSEVTCPNNYRGYDIRTEIRET